MKISDSIGNIIPDIKVCLYESNGFLIHDTLTDSNGGVSFGIYYQNTDSYYFKIMDLKSNQNYASNRISIDQCAMPILGAKTLL